MWNQLAFLTTLALVASVQARPKAYPRQASGTVSASASAATASSTTPLHSAALSAGKLYFGSATDNPELTDEAYVTILSNNKMFGQITPGNSMKWARSKTLVGSAGFSCRSQDATEPSRGDFTFAQGDVIANLAATNGQLLRGHNCVWYNQLPSWVSSGGFDNATLTEIVATHCGTLVGHYAGKVYVTFVSVLSVIDNERFLGVNSWDVINEPFNDDGTWRSDVFFNTMGESFVGVALKAARAADPKAKLYINDYNIEGTGAKSTAMVNLVKSLKAQGIPIDGIGIQSHLIVGEVPSTLKANFEQFTALGVEIAVTELDIRMTLPETDALLAQQKADYETVISTCAAVEKCIGVTIWDYTDKYSWVPSTFPGQASHESYPLIWNTYLQDL
ncbi:related to Endo-1,4-beta-xylanase [Armillaria ostoyae]|uniref:Beta-xylanase n=1 Tax=Armillaria ostoyae TaxID=47428 RepID=A0A284QNM5_ARMOS|nr:related to Endo-1,4-beta-xylanase [Armillaria ostoyae]